MSNKTLQVERNRFTYDGDEMIHLIVIYMNVSGTGVINRWFEYSYADETDFVENKMFRYIDNEEVRDTKNGIVETILQMRENDDRAGILQIKEIPIEQSDELKPHSSCKMNVNEGSSSEMHAKNGVSQSELKQKLAAVIKGSEVLNFFEDKKCSVCLSNYKEVLDEDLHIVIPSCGHPLCCKCADNLLERKKECPLCRGRITADSFDLMKFNADLQIDARNHQVFL